MRILGPLGSGIGHLTTAWGLLPLPWQTAIIAMLSALTGYLGFESGGLYWALLGASAMFAFGMAGAYYFILLRSQTTVFERLIAENLSIEQIYFVPKDETR